MYILNLTSKVYTGARHIGIGAFKNSSNLQLFTKRQVRCPLRGQLHTNSHNGSHTQSLSVKLFIGSAVAVKFATGAIYVSCKQAKHPPVLPSDLRGSTEEKQKKVTADNELETQKFDWALFWKFLKPQIHYFIGAIATALVVAMANVQIPLLLGDIVNVVAESANSANSDLSQFWQSISAPGIKLFKLYIVQASFTFGYITCLTLMGERLALQLRQELFESLLRQDIAFYDQHRTGEIVNRLTADVQDFKSSFKMCVSQGIRSITQMVGSGAALYNISPSLAGGTALLYAAIISTGTMLGSLLRSLSREAQQQVAASTGVAEECLGNVRTVRSFASEPHEAAMFAAQLDKSRAINERLGFGIGLFQAGSNLFLNGVVLGVLWHGGALVASGTVRPGDLMTYLTASQTMQRSLGQLSVLFGYYVRGVSAASRVFDYLKLSPTIPLQGGKRIPYHSLCGAINFNKISFTYPTRPQQKVLEDFSLEVPAGKVVALVGESGAGKTTIGHLLERFYDVDAGSISIDGVDLKSLDPAWLRGDLIGFIHQEPVLFATTVMENIRYGRPGATDAEVIEAARIANADSFIRGFPAGYKTVVGDRGVTVSGGQKQRIAIARALLKNPRILVLDEATSALDAESERVVQAALEQCSVGRTVLIIAHRLSTIQSADIIAVMHKGRLIEMGTHESLMKRKGYYTDLIKQQQK